MERSRRKILCNTGPNHEPCGTPIDAKTRFGLFRLELFCRRVNASISNLVIRVGNLVATNWVISIWYQTLSKVLSLSKANTVILKDSNVCK